MDRKEIDSSTMDDTANKETLTASETLETTKSNVVSDDAGYHTPYDQERKIVTSPSSPFEDDYNEDMILSDEELVDYIEDDEDEGENDTFRELPEVPREDDSKPLGVALRNDEAAEVEDNDADDESEVDRRETDMQRSLGQRTIAPQLGLGPISPSSRRARRTLTSRLGNRDTSSTATATSATTSSRSHLIRYIRSKVGNARSSSDDALPESMSTELNDIEDSSTSEDSYEDESSDSSWDIGGATNGNRDLESESVVWSQLPAVPQHFLDDQNPSSPYIDASLLERLDEISEVEADRFIMEHGLFLQAVLQLLAERDQVGVEGSMDSSDNIWKKGPLKKRSAIGRRRSRPTSKWKIKFVELRKGNLCYYEDSGTSGGRKIVHLRQADTVVREVISKASGFVFEVAVEGYPSRVWMASSEEERQAWIKAIQAAMIGEDVLYRELDLRPHQAALDHFTACRQQCIESTEIGTYIHSVRRVVSGDVGLRVPMQWVRDVFVADTEASRITFKDSKSRRAPHRILKTSIHQFWKNLSKSSFIINESLVPSEGSLGSLTRCILEYDKAFVPEEDNEERTNLVSELQAVSYARDIMMVTMRSKDKHDSAYAVSNLLKNPSLVLIESRSEEPVHIEVSWAGEDLPEESAPPGTSTDKSGWLRTKPKKAGSRWRKRYAVLSGSVLSYYEAALPRPHGLLGQVVFESTSLVDGGQEDNEFVLTIETEEKRMLGFDTEEEFMEWKEAIQSAVDSCMPTLATTTSGSLSKSLLKGAERVIKGAIPGESIRGGIRAIKGAKDGGIKVIRSAKDGGIKVIRGGIRGARGILRPSRHTVEDARRRGDMKRRPSMQMLMNNTPAGKKDPTVQCVAQATHVFDVTGIESNEILFSVRSKIFQAFLLSGGINGQLSRGDALVELEFLGLDASSDILNPQHSHAGGTSVIEE